MTATQQAVCRNGALKIGKDIVGICKWQGFSDVWQGLAAGRLIS
jgi:hypothetical protein